MDLRFDVGIDGKLARLQFLTLEEIYNAATEKITQNKCNSFEEYAKNNYKVEVRYLFFAIQKQKGTIFVYFCIAIVKNQENGAAQKHI